MSKFSDHWRCHVGAVITQRKRVISTGFNKNKTHPEQLKYNQNLPYKVPSPNLHAEIDAIVRCSEDTHGATIYVFRRGGDQRYREAKPCPACAKKIKDSGIKRIVHTTLDGIKEQLL